MNRAALAWIFGLLALRTDPEAWRRTSTSVMASVGRSPGVG
jgi:hypothetical protein